MSGRLVAWLGLVAALAALGYGARAAGGEPARDALFRYESFVGGVIQYAVILVIVLAITGRHRELLALRRPTSLRAAFGYSALALVATYIIAVVVESFANPGEEQGLLPKEWDPSRALPFALNFVMIALIAPAVEELTFRGLGYSLLERYGQVVAVVAVGLAFGLVHGLLVALPILAVFGAGLALIRARTQSVYPSFVTHALFNALSLTLAVTT